MIVTTDIQNILFLKCKDLGIEDIRQNPKEITGELSSEMIAIHAKPQKGEKYWKKDFVEVNLCVPDIEGEADLIRIGELERIAQSKLESVGKYDETSYRYSIYSTGIESDEGLKCHYVNVRLLFEVLNVKL